MTAHREKAAVRTTKNAERVGRVAHLLYDNVKELQPNASPHTSAVLARGIALRAQLLKLAPAAFDCENGRDALAAIGHGTTISELRKLANSSALALDARWAKIVTIVMLKLPPGSTNPFHTRRDNPPRDNVTWPPKLLDGWIPK